MIRSVLTLLLVCFLLVVANGQDPAKKLGANGQPCIPVSSETISGKVVSVNDGDTISIQTAERKLIAIRFEGIDAPEKTQDSGTQAKETLSSWIKGEMVDVGVTGKDKDGRTRGFVSHNSKNINERLVKEGWAWQHREFNCDPVLAKLESEAKEAKRGLWSHDNPIPPWEFRKTAAANDSKSAKRTVKPAAPKSSKPRRSGQVQRPDAADSPDEPVEVY